MLRSVPASCTNRAVCKATVFTSRKPRLQGRTTKHLRVTPDHYSTKNTWKPEGSRTVKQLRSFAVRATPAPNSGAASIAPIGLRLWRISGDGRCMFRALVQGAHLLDHGKSLKLFEEQQAADKLRKKVCDSMRRKRDDISPFLEVDFDEYIAGMSQSYTWGGEPELSVVPECLDRTVEVYMNGATGLQVMSTYLLDQKDKDPVKILFNGIGHYDLLITDSATSKL